jgi:hypothetical protein
VLLGLGVAGWAFAWYRLRGMAADEA